MIGHLEARNRAMNIMVYGRGFSIEDGVMLNRLRRRMERWTDMLLGRIMLQHDISDLAFDAQRARDFATDLALNRRTLLSVRCGKSPSHRCVRHFGTGSMLRAPMPISIAG